MHYWVSFFSYCGLRALRFGCLIGLCIHRPWPWLPLVARPRLFIHEPIIARPPLPSLAGCYRSDQQSKFSTKNSASCKNQFIDKLAACTKLFILNQSLIQYCINIELFSSKNYPVCFDHSVVIKFQYRCSCFRFSLCNSHFYSLITCRCRYCWCSCYV